MICKTNKQQKYENALILLIAVVFGVMQAKAYDFEVDGIYYNFTLSPSGVEVTYFIDYRHDDFDGEGDYYGDIVIPPTVTFEGKTYNVIRIGSQAFREASIRSVVIPASIYSIGNWAFYDCFLEKIEVQWNIPLDGINDNYIFGNRIEWFDRVTLIVPRNTRELYQKALGWRDFHVIEESDSEAPSVDNIYTTARFHNDTALLNDYILSNGYFTDITNEIQLTFKQDTVIFIISPSCIFEFPIVKDNSNTKIKWTLKQPISCEVGKSMGYKLTYDLRFDDCINELKEPNEGDIFATMQFVSDMEIQIDYFYPEFIWCINKQAYENDVTYYETFFPKRFYYLNEDKQK